MIASHTLWDTVPKKNILPFYTPDKELDYQKVVKTLNLKNSDVAKGANISIHSVRYDEKIPAELKERIEEWVNLLQLVAQHFQDADKTLLWFKMPNPLLGNVSPRDMIRYGRYQKLLKFVLNALRENKQEQEDRV